MERSQLIHSNEAHLIEKSEIHSEVEKMVESLNLAAGSTDGFNLYQVVEAYFTELDKRHLINDLLGIPESSIFYGEEEQEKEYVQ